MTSRKNNAKNASQKEAAIQAIATSILHLETLEERRRDSLDFHELSIWSIRDALDAAYEAGRKAKR
jgi:hypothetical protein